MTDPITTTATAFYVEIVADDGDVPIYEDELASITAANLKMLRISRKELRHVFAKGKELMTARGANPDGRIRPLAAQLLDGSWFVGLVADAPRPPRPPRRRPRAPVRSGGPQ